MLVRRLVLVLRSWLLLMAEGAEVVHAGAALGALPIVEVVDVLIAVEANAENAVNAEAPLGVGHMDLAADNLVVVGIVDAEAVLGVGPIAVAMGAEAVNIVDAEASLGVGPIAE